MAAMRVVDAVRIAEEVLAKYNPNHDAKGRFGPGSIVPKSAQPKVGPLAAAAIRSWVSGDDVVGSLTHTLHPDMPGYMNLKDQQDQARALLQTVQQSATSKVLYRGIAVPREKLSGLNEGETFDVLLGSATPSRAVADSFALNPGNTKPGDIPVRLRFVGKKRALDITSYSDSYASEKESIISGRFRVITGKTTVLDGTGYDPDSSKMRGIEVTVEQIADVDG